MNLQNMMVSQYLAEVMTLLPDILELHLCLGLLTCGHAYEP